MNIRKTFTLVEFIAVTLIVAMTAGVVITKIGKVPSNILIDQVAAKIEVVMNEASHRAILQSGSVAVLFKIESRYFELESDIDGYAASVVTQKYSKYQIPDDIEVEAIDDGGFDGEDGVVKFVYNPDGTGDGPAFVIRVKGHQRKLEISPLTGMVIISNDD